MEGHIRPSKPNLKIIFWMTAIYMANILVIPVIVEIVKFISKILHNKRGFKDSLKDEVWHFMWAAHGVFWAIPILLMSLSVVFCGQSVTFDKIVVIIVDSNLSMLVHLCTIVHFLKVYNKNRKSCTIFLLFFFYSLFAIIIEYHTWKTGALVVK